MEVKVQNQPVVHNDVQQVVPMAVNSHKSSSDLASDEWTVVERRQVRAAEVHLNETKAAIILGRHKYLT